MSMTFADLQTEVKTRSIRNKSGSEFDARVKNVINTSLFRVARASNWRQLRRESSFETVAAYTTGTGAVAVTNNSKNVTVTGATFLTDGIEVGRRIDLGGSSQTYQIKTITGETTLTLDRVFDGTTSTTQSYKIYGQEEYNLPVQAGRIAMLWHEDYGYPFVMGYVPDIAFYNSSNALTQEDTPVYYRQWSIDNVQSQPKQAGTLSLSSSSTSDTAIDVTVFGTVSSFPDYEIITTNSSDGTTAATSTKSFSEVERVVKNGSTVGRITVTADSGNTTVATLPVGDSTADISYMKVQVFPYPTEAFPINVLYYKDPWRLVNDGDVHELGAQFDEAIILLATARLNFAQSKDEGQSFYAMYQDEIKDLKKYNADRVLDYQPKLRRPSRRGFGTLGSRFLNYSQIGNGNFGPRVG